jgi:multimeric flavodoxin WrbA
MKIIGINASPRKSWNTSLMVEEAMKGAASKGAETELVNLYDLAFKGCISCFGCKLAPNIGHCIVNDELKPVLDKIREADGLVLGTPNYLSDVTAGTRAVIERLIFPLVSYKKEPPMYKLDKQIPVLFIMTSNCPESFYEKTGYNQLIKGIESSLSALGPVKTVISSDTLQVNNYEKYNWTMFDVEAKKKRRETVFPTELKKAFEAAMEMIGKCGRWN